MGAPLASRRFDDILYGTETTSIVPPAESIVPVKQRFHHVIIPTLPHLLALIVHPPQDFPPPCTSVLVIDALSTLLEGAYNPTSKGRSGAGKLDAAKWAAGRRFAVRNELVSKLGKLAVLRDIAILVTCQTITRVRFGVGASLLPAISGNEWESGISTQIAIFRDWPPEREKDQQVEEGRWRRMRFFGVVKVGGTTMDDNSGVGSVVPFTIDRVGISFSVTLS